MMKEKIELACKCVSVHLEVKLRMIRKYEGRQSLLLVPRELDFAVSTINSFMKNAAHMRGSEISAGHNVGCNRKGEDAIRYML